MEERGLALLCKSFPLPLAAEALANTQKPMACSHSVLFYFSPYVSKLPTEK